jgi:hypothetical protein
MTRSFFLLFAVLGLASSRPGCATREFVLKDLARCARALGPTVARFARDFQEHRTAARELAGQAAEVDRLQEGVTRERSRRSAWRTWQPAGRPTRSTTLHRPLARRRGRPLLLETT